MHINHKHSFPFNMVTKSKPISLFGSISKSVASLSNMIQLYEPFSISIMIV